MNFKRAETNEGLSVLRFVSDAGVWEIGLWPVMFGVRVRLGRVDNRVDIVLDYCAGDSLSFQMELLMAVMIILKKVPEDVEPWVIGQQFPGYAIRPIDRDPTCWPELQKMRDKVLDEFREAPNSAEAPNADRRAPNALNSRNE